MCIGAKTDATTTTLLLSLLLPLLLSGRLCRLHCWRHSWQRWRLVNHHISCCTHRVGSNRQRPTHGHSRWWMFRPLGGVRRVAAIRVAGEVQGTQRKEHQVLRYRRSNRRHKSSLNWKQNPF